MKKTAYLGIDGGGTKTDCALCDSAGRIVRRQILRGCNPTVCGIDGMTAVLREGIAALSVGDYKVAGAFAGIAGCVSDERRNAIRSVLSSFFPGIPVDAHADILNVVCLTEHRERCVAAICGTGSAAFAVSGGDLFRVGGWGPLFDTAGSGYDVGREAIRAALAEEDGFGEHTLLTEAVRQKLGPSVFDGAASLPANDPSAVAAFAPLVFAAEKKGDARAASILRDNFARLAFLINRAAALYSCGPHVVLAGGVTGETEAIGRYLAPALDPELRLTVVTEAPVCGALAAARALAGK
ncbi:MAG: XRE family transcriptional regulator [Clostridia bacterium]|nr:XRE family transcriptional regulator [Clostridia bacterium]